MIGQCLSNKNENATISKFKKKLDVNKGERSNWVYIWRRTGCLHLQFSACNGTLRIGPKNSEIYFKFGDACEILPTGKEKFLATWFL